MTTPATQIVPAKLLLRGALFSTSLRDVCGFDLETMQDYRSGAPHYNLTSLRLERAGLCSEPFTLLSMELGAEQANSPLVAGDYAHSVAPTATTACHGSVVWFDMYDSSGQLIGSGVPQAEDRGTPQVANDTCNQRCCCCCMFSLVLLLLYVLTIPAGMRTQCCCSCMYSLFLLVCARNAAAAVCTHYSCCCCMHSVSTRNQAFQFHPRFEVSIGEPVPMVASGASAPHLSAACSQLCELSCRRFVAHCLLLAVCCSQFVAHSCQFSSSSQL